MSEPSLEQQANDRSDETSSTAPPNVTEATHRQAREMAADPPGTSGPGSGEEVRAAGTAPSSNPQE